MPVLLRASSSSVGDGGGGRNLEELDRSLNMLGDRVVAGVSGRKRKLDVIKSIEYKRLHFLAAVDKLESLKARVESDLERDERETRRNRLLLRDRPWIERFKEAIFPSDDEYETATAAAAVLGLPDDVLSSLSLEPEEQQGQLLSAAAALAEAVKDLKELSRAKLLHLIRSSLQLKKCVEDCEIPYFQPNDLRLSMSEVMTKLSFYLDSINDWTKLSQCESEVLAELVGEMADVPRFVAKIIKCASIA